MNKQTSRNVFLNSQTNQHDLEERIAQILTLIPLLLQENSHRSISLTLETRIGEKQFAEISGLGVSTIQKLRLTDSGPPFEKHGRRVLYRYGDVLDWLSKRQAKSTSDAIAKGLSQPLCKSRISFSTKETA